MPAILLCGYHHGDAQLEARINRAVEVFHDVPHPKRIYYFSNDMNDTGVWSGDDVRERLLHRGLLARHFYLAPLASNTREEVSHLLLAASETELCGVTSNYHKPRLWRTFQEHGHSVEVHTTAEGTRLSDYIREAGAWSKLSLTSGLAH